MKLRYRLMQDPGTNGGEPGGGSGDGSPGISTENWREILPEELRSHPSLESFKDLPSLAKAYVETKSMVGRSLRIPSKEAPKEQWDEFRQKVAEYGFVPKPPEGATDEELREFYKALGVPESPKDYGNPLEGKEIEGITPDMIEELAGKAHSLGLNPQQFSGILDWMAEQQQLAMESAQETTQSELKALKDEWGTQYPVRLAAAKKVINAFADQALQDEIDEVGLENVPRLLKMLSTIGLKFMEDEIITDKKTGEPLPPDLDAEINSLMRTQAYLDPNHPEHEKIVKRVAQLYEIKYGDAA